MFESVLKISSKGLVTGKIFYIGIHTSQLPQLVPKMVFDEKIPFGNTGLFIEGQQSKGLINVLTEPIDIAGNLANLSETAVHELLHSLRLDHPFERTISKDTKLKKDITNTDSYMTCPGTDPNIFYNIMNYNFITIDGYL